MNYWMLGVFFSVPILFFIYSVTKAVEIDVKLYKNPLTRTIVSSDVPKDDKGLKQLFLDQNLWEYTIFLAGYIAGGLLVLLI